MKIYVVSSGLSNAALTVSVQLIALAALIPEDYGRYSFGYLLVGLGVSSSFSFVIDIWVRAGFTTPWREFGSVIFWFSAIFGTVCLVVLLVSGSQPRPALFFAMAICLSVFRNAARFYSMHHGEWRPVVVADLMGLATLVGCFFAARAFFGPYDALLYSWCASAAITVLFSRSLRPSSPEVFLKWVARNWQEIRGLWGESSLLDLSSIGTPLILYSFMSISAYGVYRGISNAAVPARLVLTPLRPVLSRGMRTNKKGDWKHHVAAIAAGTVFGCIVLIALTAVQALQILPNSVLPVLAQYAIPAALFAFGTSVSYIYYVSARATLRLRQLGVARSIETVVMILCPIIGFLVAGLSGAVFGFSTGSLLTAACWMLLVTMAARSNNRNTRSESGTEDIARSDSAAHET